VAGQQLNLATFAQLKAAGLDKSAIRRRRRKGTLHRVHRGVYLFGAGIMLPGAAELAAIMACGAGTVVSHRSAAALWGFVARTEGDVEVTVVGRSRRSQAGIKLHRVNRLAGRDRTSRSGIPVTTPARTIVDLADDRDLERVINQARVRRLASDQDLRWALDRAGPKRGVARLRGMLDAETDADYSRSAAERRMRRLLKQAGLPAVRSNILILGHEVDFLWPGHKLIVEVDGYRFHGHRAAFESDRRRDMALIAAGYRVIRITWRQLKNEPMMVAATIASALAVTAGDPGDGRS
jgi:very-short-patch-repair endonuclease